MATSTTQQHHHRSTITTATSTDAPRRRLRLACVAVSALLLGLCASVFFDASGLGKYDFILQEMQQQSSRITLLSSRTTSGPDDDDEDGAAALLTGDPQQHHYRLLTVREIKERMVLPCNYVHDGYYVTDSNEILNQVHQSLLYHLQDDVIPVVVECGGHDGITKSQTLKVSRCLSMNTLLIEGSPSNYRVLERTRGSYDRTVHAALCEGESTQLVEHQINSGETHVLRGAREAEKLADTTQLVTAPCTSVDAELDKLRQSLPRRQQDKLQLIMLVLDIEGHEGTAIDGVQKYTPHKVFMEEKHLSKPDREKVATWAQSHNLKAGCSKRQDTCYNFDPSINDGQQKSSERLQALLYGARLRVPTNTYRTKEASQSYMFYGQ